MKLFGDATLTGGITLAVTVACAGWAMLRNRIDRLRPASDPDLDQMLRDARAAFRKKQKGLRAALASIDAADGIGQLDSYHEKRATLIDVLDTRFSSDDLSKDRYLAISDSVHAGLLSNLASRVNMEKAISHTDPIDLERRIRLAEQAGDYDYSHVVSLKERLQHIGDVRRNIGLLGAANEDALTALDSSIVELSLLDIASTDSFGRLEGAIAKLEHLVAQAHKLSAHANVSTTSEYDGPLSPSEAG